MKKTVRVYQKGIGANDKNFQWPMQNKINNRVFNYKNPRNKYSFVYLYKYLY